MAARTDPFNYILEMEMSICLKQQLGETFWMEEVLQCKGKQKRGCPILLAKLSSTKTLFIKNTKAIRSSWSISLEEPIGRLQRVEKKVCLNNIGRGKFSICFISWLIARPLEVVVQDFL